MRKLPIFTQRKNCDSCGRDGRTQPMNYNGNFYNVCSACYNEWKFGIGGKR